MSDDKPVTCETQGHLWGHGEKCVFCQTPKPKTSSVQLTDEQKQLIDQLAGSISRLCHQVISRRLQQFAEEIASILEQQAP